MNAPSLPQAVRPPLRVLVVDDDALVRSALTLMLGGQSDLEVVGEADNGQAALEAVTQLRPTVVLMDIRMPVLDGLEATRRLAAQSDRPRIIVLTTFDADEYVLGALAAGADGFLVKDTPPQQIVDAVRRVADGEAMLSPSVTRTVVDQLRQPGNERSAQARMRLEALTEREREVAMCVAQGLSNSDVARQLYLSIPTVKAHVSKVMDKLEATNRVQVAICVHEAQQS